MLILKVDIGVEDGRDTLLMVNLVYEKTRKEELERSPIPSRASIANNQFPSIRSIIYSDLYINLKNIYALILSPIYKALPSLYTPEHLLLTLSFNLLLNGVL